MERLLTRTVDLDAPVVHVVSWYEAGTDAALGRCPPAWRWRASTDTAYPGFVPAAGAVGEYNGKFMVNTQVLRGSRPTTPPGHALRTYRNCFPPPERWAFAGLRPPTPTGG